MKKIKKMTSNIPYYTLRYSKKAKRIILRIIPLSGLEVVLPVSQDPTILPAILKKMRPWVEKNLQKMGLPSCYEQNDLYCKEDKESFFLRQTLPSIPFPLYFYGGREVCLVGRTKEEALHAKEQLLHGIEPLSQKTLTPKECMTILLPQNVQKDIGQLTIKGKVWLKEQIREKARSELGAKVHILSEEYGFTPVSLLRIGFQKTRWGSYSSRGTMSLNALAIFLPSNLIQYLILHELCHTKIMNHSYAFWRLLASMEPNAVFLRKQMRFAKKYIPNWLR